MTENFKCNGVVSDHTLHFGRPHGVAIAEVCGVTSEDIRIMGNWNPNTVDKAYSTHLPINALVTLFLI